MTSKWAAALAASTLMLAATPVSGQNEASQPAGVEDVPAGRELVCRRLPSQPGTRFLGRRICKTETEWSMMEIEQRQFMNFMSDRSRVKDNCNLTPDGTFVC